MSISRGSVFFFLDTEVLRVPDTAVKEMMEQLSDTLACYDDKRWPWGLLLLERGQGQNVLECPAPSPVLRPGFSLEPWNNRSYSPDLGLGLRALEKPYGGHFSDQIRLGYGLCQSERTGRAKKEVLQRRAQ